MIELLRSIAGFLSAVYEFFLGLVDGLVYCWNFIQSSVVAFGGLITYLPGFLEGALLTFLCVGIIKIIIGRQ